MKQLLTILCLVLLVSCSNEVSSDKLVYRNGLIYEINSTTLFTGSSVGYHENGLLKEKGNFKDGKRDGLQEIYYDNGKLWVRENHKDGKLDGLVEYFSPYGILNGIEEYKDGRLIK